MKVFFFQILVNLNIDLKQALLETVLGFMIKSNWNPSLYIFIHNHYFRKIIIKNTSLVCCLMCVLVMKERAAELLRGHEAGQVLWLLDFPAAVT